MDQMTSRFKRTSTLGLHESPLVVVDVEHALSGRAREEIRHRLRKSVVRHYDEWCDDLSQLLSKRTNMWNGQSVFPSDGCSHFVRWWSH